MPAYGTTKVTTSSPTRTFDVNMEALPLQTLAVGATTGTVIQVGEAEMRGEVVLEVVGGGTFAAGATLLLEGSTDAGMTSAVALAQLEIPAGKVGAHIMPFTSRPEALAATTRFDYIRATVTLGGADTFDAVAWIARPKN
jgi:ABC-type amino acid transport substrate-binding protein